MCATIPMFLIFSATRVTRFCRRPVFVGIKRCIGAGVCGWSTGNTYLNTQINKYKPVVVVCLYRIVVHTEHSAVDVDGRFGRMRLIFSIFVVV
jgi:hypothetical protein